MRWQTFNYMTSMNTKKLRKNNNETTDKGKRHDKHIYNKQQLFSNNKTII